MQCIGLTGGIASGKSTVAGMLREMGAHVIDADVLSRQLTAPGGAALPAIRAGFGDRVFQGEGLDRAALGQLIFNSQSARERLNALMFPRIRAGIRKEIADAEARGTTRLVVDAPILFEMELDAFLSPIWVCVLPGEVQIARLMARGGYSRAQALRRIRSQMPQAELVSRADAVIDTTGALDDIRAQVRSLWLASGGKE